MNIAALKEVDLNKHTVNEYRNEFALFILWNHPCTTVHTHCLPFAVTYRRDRTIREVYDDRFINERQVSVYKVTSQSYFLILMTLLYPIQSMQIDLSIVQAASIHSLVKEG